MKITLLAFGLLAAPLFAADPVPRKPENVSFRNEIQLAIDKGVAFLKTQQTEDGSWSNPEHPALTAITLLALHRAPGQLPKTADTALMQKGYDYLRKNVQPDGGIYTKGLSNYNTSLALTALLNTGKPEDEPLINKARTFIVAQQATGMANPSVDGGIGYGPTGVSPKRAHPDLDNTLISLEALRAYRQARPTVEIAAKDDLNWQAAIDFISRTQNLPSHNPAGSADPKDKGGFIYYPGYSNADPAEGPKALRSYGTMSYAGLLSFVYADLKKSDPRVTAALEWLSKNYTLEENPGMGRSGLYYYYHLASKGLAAAGITTLQTADGKKVEWSRELGMKLLNLQTADGSWVNDSARWMEKDPVLVTDYCVLSLAIIFNQL